MKKINFNAVYGILALAAVMLLFGCLNPFEPQLDRGKKAAEGNGYVTVSINKTDARTIVPENTQDSFTQYKLEFYVSGVTNPVKTEFLNPSNIGDEIEMPVGTYDLWVTAYTYFISKEDDSQNTPVAKGNKEVVVENNKPSGASVKLFAIEDGEGTFKWSISYPAGASATITIEPLDEWGTLKKVWTIADTPSADNEKGKADSVELRSGTYRVTFDLLDTEGRSLKRSDILHVYMNMESFFGKNGEGDFKEDYFIIKRVNSIALAVATVKTNTQLTLEGVVSPSSATFKDIEWEIIDDPYNTGATITDGVFLSKKAERTGSTVKLKATIEHGAGYLVDYVQEDNLELTVTFVEVDGIEIDPEEIELDDGTIKVITAKATPPEATNKNLIWRPYDSSGIFEIIEINDEDGTVKIKGLKPGTTKVEVLSESNTRLDNAECKVTVNPVPLTGLTLSAEYVMLPSTGTVEERTTVLRAIFAPPNATFRDLIWSSDNTGITVIDGEEGSGEGIVTVVSAGPQSGAIITVTNSKGEVTATCDVIVDDDAKGITGVGLHTDVFPDGIKLQVGKKLQLIPAITPKDVETYRVFWASGDFDVVSVVDDGKIRIGHGSFIDHPESFKTAEKDVPDGTIEALKAGIVDIVVTVANSGKYAVCRVEAYDVDPAQPAIEKIELPEDLHFTRGYPEYIEPIFTPANAANKNLFWHSSDVSVASINERTGLVTAYVPGFTTISVVTEDGGLTAECEIEVDYVPIGTVEIITTTLMMNKNQTITVRVSVYPANATYREVEWFIDEGDEAIAIVNKTTGAVTYLGGPTGTARTWLNVRSVNQPDKNARCRIQAREGNPLVTGIRLNVHKLRAGTDPTTPPMPLVATITPANAEFNDLEKDISWYSTDNYIAEVDQDGQVIGKNPGKVQIIVMTKDGGITDTCEVEIYSGKMAATGITAGTDVLFIEAPSNASMFDITATILPEGTTGEIIWERERNGNRQTLTVVGSVYSGNNYLGQALGTYVITSVEGGFTTQVVVSQGGYRHDVAMSTDSLDLELGREATLKAYSWQSGYSSDTKNFAWRSLNSTIAEVTVDAETGIATVIPKAIGKVNITAIALIGGQRRIIAVTVRAKGDNDYGTAVNGIRLNTKALTLAPGQKSGNSLQAFIGPFIDHATTAANTAVYWSSSVPRVATVDQNGVVTAVYNGTAIITATTIDGGYTDTCTVTVQAISGTQPSGLQPIVWKYLTLNLQSYPQIGEYNWGTFKPTFIGSVTPAANQKFDYFISDPAIVDVNEDNGRITAKAVGKTVVTATTVNGHRQSIDVTVVPAGPNAAIQSVYRVVLPATLTVEYYDPPVKFYTVEPVNAASRELVWTSDNNNVKVKSDDGMGNVTFEGLGKSVITATSVDGGKTQSCTVTLTVANTLISGHTDGNFYMGKYLITQEVYQMVMGSNPSSFKDNPDPGEIQGRRPVESVNKYEAMYFCNQLSTREGLSPYYYLPAGAPPVVDGGLYWNLYSWSAAAGNGYRLATNSQWQYAYRAGTAATYYWGANWDDAYGWISTNSNNKTHQVGLKLPNAWGLYDMAGNVRVWSHENPGNFPERAGISGGAWSLPAARSAVTGGSGEGVTYVYPYSKYNNLGIRVIRPAP